MLASHVISLIVLIVSVVGDPTTSVTVISVPAPLKVIDEMLDNSAYLYESSVNLTFR
jgi:hypothetical protein